MRRQREELDRECDGGEEKEEEEEGGEKAFQRHFTRSI